MRNPQDGNWFKRILHSYFGLAILAVLILFFAWSVIKFAGKAQETARNKEIAIEKLVELQKQEVQLSSEINALNTEKGTEASIREKFGLAKEGEGLIVVVDEENKTTKINQEIGFWSFLKNLFK